MSSRKILEDLPSKNPSNFSNFKSDSHKKKMPTYLCTEEHPVEQVIVSDRSNILLRYLYQQLDKKLNGEKSEKRKNEAGNTRDSEEPESTSRSNSDGPPPKQPRMTLEPSSFDKRKEKRA